MCPGLQIVPTTGHFPDKIRGCSGFLDFDRQYELLGQEFNDYRLGVSPAIIFMSLRSVTANLKVKGFR